MNESHDAEEIKALLAQSKAVAAETQIHLEEIKRVRSTVDDLLKATEVIRKKADDDATYAFQAKENAEKHAKSVSAYKGDIEAHVSSIANNRKAFEELTASATIAKATLDSDVAKTAESRKIIDSNTTQLVQLVAEKLAESSRISEIKAAVESSRAETERLKNEAQAWQTTAAEEAAKAAKLANQAAESASKIHGHHSHCTQQSSEIATLLKAARDNDAALSAITKRLETNDSSATAHEERVKILSEKLHKLNDTAEALLPGATSAGLASSFKSQRSRFDIPQQRWLKVFIWCIGGLILVAFPSFLNAILGLNSNDGWEVVLKGMAVRAPIVIPLVWLAIYAGRNYMLSIRIEEEYAYKEAVSMAFEGYKKQMEAIGAGDPKSPTPLTALCMNVLASIAERPGRIYEGRQSKISLADEARDLPSALNELRNRQVG